MTLGFLIKAVSLTEQIFFFFLGRVRPFSHGVDPSKWNTPANQAVSSPTRWMTGLCLLCYTEQTRTEPVLLYDGKDCMSYFIRLSSDLLYGWRTYLHTSVFSGFCHVGWQDMFASPIEWVAQTGLPEKLCPIM